MKRSKKWFGLMFTLVLSFILVACGEELPDLSENENSEAAAEEFDVDTTGEDVLVIGMSNAPNSQNPFFCPRCI